MDIRFDQYRFNTESKVLYKQSEIIALKRKQAEILHLFLSQPDTIFSKADILNTVWARQEVSEQVVFQNISALRRILGDGAIRTFPKKGYKWQRQILEVQANSMDISETVDGDIRSESTEQVLYSKTSIQPKTVATLISIVVILMGFWWTSTINKPNSSLPSRLQLLLPNEINHQTSASFEDLVTNALANEVTITPHSVNTSLTQMFATPLRQQRNNQQLKSDWMLWGHIYTSDNGQFLHYALVKDSLVWEEYIFAQEHHHLKQKFAGRFLQLGDLGLFKQEAPEISASFLKRILGSAPNDLKALLTLAEHQVDIQQFDAALAYLSKLQSLAGGYGQSPYLAQALWLKGKIYKMQSQHQQASDSLKQMAQISEQTPIWPLNFINIKTSALLAYEEHNQTEMMSVLKRGIRLAKQQADPYTLFELHILFAMLAENSGFEVEKYDQLNQAQALLLKHQLDESNRAIVYFHFAKFTDDNDKAIPYLQQVLTLPRSSQNYWLQDEALNILVDHYLAQGQLEQARQQLDLSPKSLHKSVLEAQVLLAEKEQQAAHRVLLQAFDTARLEYKRHIGIEIAYLLYGLTENHPTEQAEYKAYLITNAKPNWLLQRNLMLANP